VIYSWGDGRSTKQVAPDDGFAVLCYKTTDLGGGNYHYEYALYNQTSARSLEALSIPIGTATITNAGFRDIDYTAGNAWTFTAADGFATWRTSPYPGPSNPLLYQVIYNFWFDANAAPGPATATVEIYAPGTGDYQFFDTNAPFTGGVAALEIGLPVSGVKLYPVEPNPFGRSTQVAFALGSERAARLTVLDVGGRAVKTLFDATAPAGRTALRWDGRDDAGSNVASGIYFFRLESGQASCTTKGVLLK
jgi:hypothetical protein